MNAHALRLQNKWMDIGLMNVEVLGNMNKHAQ